MQNKEMSNLEEYRKYKYTHIKLTHPLSRFTLQDVRNTNEH